MQTEPQDNDDNNDDTIASPITRALHLRSAGDMAGAIELLFATLADDITDLPTLSTLATMLAEDEQFDRADRLFSRALGAGRPSPGLLLNYGTFLAHAGRLRPGITVFGDAMAAQSRVIQQRLHDDDARGAADALAMLGVMECNFARALLLSGEPSGALACAQKWLTAPETWDQADDVVISALEALERDVMTEIAKLHEAQQASPAMVAELGDAAAEASGDDFDAFVVFLQGSRYLFDGWHQEFDTPLFHRFQLCLKPEDMALAWAVAGDDPDVAAYDVQRDSGADAWWAAGEAAQAAAVLMAGRLREAASVD